MNLDNVIRSRLKAKARQKRKATPEEIHRSNINHVLRLIDTGDFDIRKKSHKILLNVAHKAGYITDEQKAQLKKKEG